MTHGAVIFLCLFYFSSAFSYAKNCVMEKSISTDYDILFYYTDNKRREDIWRIQLWKRCAGSTGKDTGEM